MRGKRELHSAQNPGKRGGPLPQPGLSLREPPPPRNWTAAVPFYLIGKQQATQPSSLLTDPHEDHACGHVQTPHRPGDPAVHLGTLSLAMEQGHQADPPGPRGARSQDKALNPHPIAQPRTLAPPKGVPSSPSFLVLLWFLVLFWVLPHTHTHKRYVLNQGRVEGQSFVKLTSPPPHSHRG